MVNHTPTHNLPYPTGTDSVQPRLRDFQSLAVSTDAAITTAMQEAIWSGAPLTEGQSLADLQPGVYVRVGAFSTLQSYPISGVGTVIVEVPYNAGANGAQVVTVMPEGNGPTRVFTRRRVPDGWQPWVDVATEGRWNKAPLTEAQSLADLPVGVYLRVGAFSTLQSYPISGVGTVIVEVPYNAGVNGAQIVTVMPEGNGPTRQFTRRRTPQGWQPWVDVGATTRWNKPALTESQSLATLDPGVYIRVGAFSWEQSYPISGVGTVVIEVPYFAGVNGAQIVTVMPEGNGPTRQFTRRRVPQGWQPWVEVGVGGGDLRTDMEVTGRWTPTGSGDAFLNQLGDTHEAVEVVEIGRSVQNRPIYAAVIGDPTKPAVLVNAGAHGDEVGPPEAAWLWVRSLAQPKTLAHMDLCVIVVACMNPDSRFVRRSNANSVDLNRDWLARSQPETQAVATTFADYNVVAAVDVHNFGYPRQVSLLGTTYGSTAVQALSSDLYDAAFAALQAGGHGVRDYAPGTPETSFSNGIPVEYGVPTLLIEIPCGGYLDYSFNTYVPSPAWQAHVGMFTLDAVVDYVWKNLTDFESPA